MYYIPRDNNENLADFINKLKLIIINSNSCIDNIIPFIIVVALLSIANNRSCNIGNIIPFLIVAVILVIIGEV